MEHIDGKNRFGFGRLRFFYRSGDVLAFQHDDKFIRRFRVGDKKLKQEAVEFGFGKGIGTLLFNRILGCKHEERFGEGIARFADGNLTFRHRFEQCGLNLCRSTVYFVSQHYVRKKRPLSYRKAMRGRIKDERSGEIGRQQVGCELDAFKT